MNNQQAVVDQIVQNLAFEVEAVSKDKSVQANSVSQSTPLNVKIRVRKKDEIHTQDSSLIVDKSTRNLQKIRLVTSDQTIMTFDIFMEAEFEKKPSRKLRKHIFDMLKPGICLGAADDDDYPYMPSSSYSANITEPSVTTRSDGTWKQIFTLSKNGYQDYTASTQHEEQKWFFGKIRPGGCLDPPFSEDKYSYKPTKSELEQISPELNVSTSQELHDEDNIECDVDSNKIPSKLPDEDFKSKGRSSIFDGGLFKRKRKSSDKSTNTSLPDKTDSILDIYQVESVSNSVSTHSNSIITYPPKILSDSRISDDKTVKSRGPSQDKSRKLSNDHSEPLFIPPKGVNRIKEKDTLNQREYPKERSSDISDLRNTRKESFKLPVPIPIPIPIPVKSKKSEPETIATTDDILKTQGDNANIAEVDLTPEQQLKDKMNLKDTEIPKRSQAEAATGDTDVDPVNMKDTAQQDKKKVEREPLKIPIPIPVPLDFSKSASAADPITVNDNLPTSDIKLTQPQQSFRREPAPNIIEDIPLKDSEDMMQNVDPKKTTGESEPIANAITPNSQQKYKDAELIANNYTRNEFFDKENDDKNPTTKAPIMEGDVKRDTQIIDDIVKPEKQNDNKHEDGRTAINKMPDTDTNEIQKTQNKVGKDSQRISQSKLPVLQKSMSILSNSKTPDRTKRNDSAEKQSYKVQNPDTDFSDKKKSLYNSPENETDIVNEKTLQSYNDKDNIAESTEPNKDDNIDTYSESHSSSHSREGIGYITAPVIIDKTGPTPNFRELKEVSSETNLLNEPIATDHKLDHTGIPFTSQIDSRFQKFNEDTAHSSQEVIGNKSIIYDMEDEVPSTSSVKNTERHTSSDKRVILPVDTGKENLEIISNSPGTSGESNKNNTRSTSVLSSIISTSTLKSAMKKDTISVELGFHSYLNDKNERILRTFDVENTPTRYPNDSITVMKSQIRISSNEVRIPVDSDHDMSLQIRKPTTNQRVSISDSGFVNLNDNGKMIKQKSPVQDSDAETRSSEAKKYNKTVENDVGDDNVIDLYEQELVPLQLIIKNLRNEIDVLAAQQLIFKDKIFCPNKSRLPRLVHTDKKCLGCVKKIN